MSSTPAPAATAGDAREPEGGRFGLVVLDGAEVAIPIRALREVLPCPPALAALPVTSPVLLGALELRDEVLPVVDVLQPREVQLGGTRIVVVLADGGRLVGLLADGIRGLVDVDADAMRSVSAAGLSLLASHTFLHPDDRRVVSVLDVGRVLALDGVPVAHERAGGAGRPARTADGGADGRRTMTVLRCATHTIAIDVADVHTIIPAPRPEPSVLAGGSCMGATPFREERVALVDPLAVLGVGTMPLGRPEAGMVLLLDGGPVVLAVSSTVDIVSITDRDVRPVPRHAVARPDLVRGLLELPSATALVIDTDALRADPDLRTLAALRTPVDPSRWGDAGSTPRDEVTDDDTAGGVVEPCLSYSIGFDLATPLDQIDEIVAMPERLHEIRRDGDIIGVAMHRGVAVPLVLLADLLGKEVAVPASTQCVLMVDVDGERWGVVVDRLNEIAQRSWRSAADDAAAMDPDTTLITLRGSRRLVPEVDLRAVLRRSVAGHPASDAVGDPVADPIAALV